MKGKDKYVEFLSKHFMLKNDEDWQMSKRYQVIKGSESGHCCFDATVVDTQTAHPMYPDEYDWVCESFDMETAQKIADALNASYRKGGEA